MKVLIGVDGSAGSNFAISLTGSLLSTEQDEVILYYAPPQVELHGEVGHDPEILQETRVALAERVFAHSRGFLPPPLGERAQCLIGEHKPRHGILAAAQQHQPDLIAVGARGTGQVTRLRLGSVSRSVVHGAHVPVLVARANERTDQPLRALLACDRTGISSEATGLVKQLSWPDNTTGYVVHVIESIFAGEIPDWLREEALHSESEPLSRIWVEKDEHNRQEVEAELSTLCQELQHPFQVNPPVVLHGHPGDQLLGFIASQEIDLAVVGSRALGPVARFFGGSTSGHLLARANCSVLVVPHHDVP